MTGVQTCALPIYVTYQKLEVEKGATSSETRAVLSFTGRATGTLKSGTNSYFADGSSSREVGIHTNWLRAEDLYVIFDQKQGGGVYFKVLVKPLVNLLWIAGIIFVIGSLVALWPDAREQRKLVSRLALARA